MTDAGDADGPLDVHVLEMLGKRAVSHPLVLAWVFQPDIVSPRRLELHLDADQYPAPVDGARLVVRWYESGDYTVQYLETRGEGVWQCRWDRHPKPDAPDAHFHPPPDASPSVDASELDDSHPLGVLFGVLDWISGRVADLHGD